MAREFIEEIIHVLKRSSIKINEDWEKFKKGEIDKEKFEEEYHQVLSGWLSEIEHEKYSPNNGCKYNDTNPESEYFKKMDI